MCSAVDILAYPSFLILENSVSDSKEEIISHIRTVMVDYFELDASQITADSNLYEDLDIDSIDTIDLIIELKKHVDKEIDEMALLECKTIGDVAEIIAKM